MPRYLIHQGRAQRVGWYVCHVYRGRFIVAIQEATSFVGALALALAEARRRRRDGEFRGGLWD